MPLARPPRSEKIVRAQMTFPGISRAQEMHRNHPQNIFMESAFFVMVGIGITSALPQPEAHHDSESHSCPNESTFRQPSGFRQSRAEVPGNSASYHASVFHEALQHHRVLKMQTYVSSLRRRVS